MVTATKKCLTEHGSYVVSQHPEHGGCPYKLLRANYHIDLGTVTCSWKDLLVCEHPEHEEIQP
jgi:hypothetical protein